MSYSAILIDDEPLIRDSLRHLGNWSSLGIEIIAEASDGKYGLELISGLKPDIVITDVKMPHMDGIELIHALRESNNDAKVIFVSGFDSFEYVRKAIGLKAIDYLLKPVKPEELNRQLARCVEELNQTRRQTDTQGLDLQGFISAALAEEYKRLSSGIFQSLHSESPEILSLQFSKLRKFLACQDAEEISRSFLICMYYDFHNQLQQYISECGYRVDEIFPNKPISYVFGGDCCADQMLHHIESLYVEAQTEITRRQKAKNRIDVAKIRQFVDLNYLKGIGLEDVAAHFYISKEYLSKVFKQESGINFSDYITSLKMNKAKELLTVSMVPIKEIASMVGYADQAHFYKAFKKYYHMTPGDMLRGN